MSSKYLKGFSEQQNSVNDGKKLKIALIGGGLVGSLAALHLAKDGHNVHLYEYREDIRKSDLVQGRSINLALSVRGRAALAEVGLEEKLLQHGIPMQGRMLHDLKGNRTVVPYDAGRKQFILSVGRKYMNEVLLNASSDYPNISLNFNHKFISGNLEEGKVLLKDLKSNKEIEVTADLIIGCDGAFSAVRNQMLKRSGFNFSQVYIEHGYLELCIPPKNNEFAMPSNFLHIWPRGKFMMIALPNQDKTWTVTLFMPFENFEMLKTSDDLIRFFEKEFPDAVPLIGKERLIKDFFKTKPQHLISVKCNPYHVGSKAVLLGDAAHAMVPFYGQGMNAGFEDCSIFSAILRQSNVQLEIALKEFSETRWQNAHSICDLAMYNYSEMRDLVTKRSFRIRKALDDFLYFLMPEIWVPLYNSVSFSRMPYKKCIENRKWQDKVLKGTGYILLLGSMAIAFYFITTHQSLLNSKLNIFKTINISNNRLLEF